MSLLKVPLPCPPVAAPHALHVMSVTVMAPVAHPTVILVGRTRGVDPGAQDSTPGREVTLVVVVVVGGDVVVDTFAVLVEPPTGADLFDGGEDLEPMVRPMAVATPTATRTSATIATRTTVVRCTVITGFLSTTMSNGSWGPCRCDRSRSPAGIRRADVAGMGTTRRRFGCPRRRFLNRSNHGSLNVEAIRRRGRISTRDNQKAIASWDRPHGPIVIQRVRGESFRSAR
jgi:hypothetical protein